MAQETKPSMESDEDMAPSSTYKLSQPTTKGNNGPHHPNKTHPPNPNQPKHQNGFVHKHEKKENLNKIEEKKDENNIKNTTNNKNESGIQIWKGLVLDILRNTLCYSLMPESGKVVVFDSALPVKHAFRALAENDIKCAPVWSSSVEKNDGDFVGFMTVTDFADILHHYVQDVTSFSRNISKLENTTVGHWCTFRKKKSLTEISRAFVYVDPDEAIFNAVFKMHQHFIHRMPIRFNKSILCILNHQAILRFVFNKTQIYHEKLSIKVSDLNYKRHKQKTHHTVKSDQKVSDAITILSTDKNITAIPICDEHGIVHDAFMRSDIRFFARNQAYMNLNVSIKNFLAKYRPTQYVPKCKKDSNLLDVLQEMLSKRCHVAIVLDENKKINNIFNYYDVFENIIGDEQMITINDKMENESQNEFLFDSNINDE